MGLNYLSVCSGIEAASVAFEPLGWKPLGFSEIDNFPSQVLADRFPRVRNFGDMTSFKEWNIDRESVNLIVGGTPCQSFSIAGLRRGMEDPRGNLALCFVSMVKYFNPEWIIWENVPGVLSSSGGRDFGSLISALGSIGYGFAWRVLDAQYFGVPQRRRRLFLVGHSSGCSIRPGKVLFESESLPGNTNARKPEGKKITGDTISGTVTSKWSKGTGGYSGDECQNLVTQMYENHPQDSRVSGPLDVSPTIAARWQKNCCAW